jgi:hypothetical protein
VTATYKGIPLPAGWEVWQFSWGEVAAKLPDPITWDEILRSGTLSDPAVASAYTSEVGTIGGVRFIKEPKA